MTEELKVTGLAVKNTVYKENDKIVTLLTAERGRITVIARGMNKPKAKLSFASFLCCGEYILLNRGKSMVLAGCDAVDLFVNIRDDLDKYYAASVLLEMADKLPDSIETGELFSCFLKGLTSLNLCEKGEEKAHLLLSVSEILTQLGYAPELKRCTLCGKELDSGRFDSMSGGLCCLEHGSSQMTLSIGELAVLKKAMQGKDVADAPTYLNEKLLSEMLNFFEICLDVRLRSKNFV